MCNRVHMLLISIHIGYRMSIESMVCQCLHHRRQVCSSYFLRLLSTPHFSICTKWFLSQPIFLGGKTVALIREG